MQNLPLLPQLGPGRCRSTGAVSASQGGGNGVFTWRSNTIHRKHQYKYIQDMDRGSLNGLQIGGKSLQNGVLAYVWALTSIKEREETVTISIRRWGSQWFWFCWNCIFVICKCSEPGGILSNGSFLAHNCNWSATRIANQWQIKCQEIGPKDVVQCSRKHLWASFCLPHTLFFHSYTD